MEWTSRIRTPCHHTRNSDRMFLRKRPLLRSGPHYIYRRHFNLLDNQHHIQLTRQIRRLATNSRHQVRWVRQALHTGIRPTRHVMLSQPAHRPMPDQSTNLRQRIQPHLPPPRLGNQRVHHRNSAPMTDRQHQRTIALLSKDILRCMISKDRSTRYVPQYRSSVNMVTTEVLSLQVPSSPAHNHVFFRP